MAVIHDLECTNPGCGHFENNAMVNPRRIPKCPRCKSKREITYAHHPWKRGVTASVNAKERAVVWANAKTGSIAYPPLNDAPMPERYSKNGYERVEMTSLRQLDTFCKQRGLTNEKASYDSSGHADEL